MRRATSIKLISEEERGAFDTSGTTDRTVYADVESVGMNEFFTAKTAGLEPEVRFVLTDYSEYHGERLVEWENVKYRVIRTYVSAYKIELTCGRETV